MIEGTTLLLAVGLLSLMAAMLGLGWWLRGRAGSPLDLYCRMGGFWHRGVHYDIRRSDAVREPYFGRAELPSDRR